MKKVCVLIFSIIAATLAVAQDHPLQAFDNLVGKTWIAEGNWGNGSVFKQETLFEYALNRTMVIGKTKGFVDENRSRYEDRNYGVRQYNAETGKISFYEFDVFGGLTSGDVKIEGNDIAYYYEYEGSKLVDLWKFVNNENYILYVGNVKDGKMEEVYLEAEVKPIDRE